MRTLTGSIVLMGLLAASLAVAGSSRAQAHGADMDVDASVATTADEVVAKYLEAVGGISALRAVNGRKTTYQVHMLGRDAYQMERTWTRPNTMRTGRPGAATYTLTEGEESWRFTPEGRRDLPSVLASSLSKRADIDGPFVDSEAKGITLTYAGVTQYDMTELHQVTVTFPDDVRWEYFFDVRTGLLKRVTLPSFFMLNGEVTQGPDAQYYYYDYRPVGSLLYPHYWIQATDDHVHLFVVEDMQLEE